MLCSSGLALNICTKINLFLRVFDYAIFKSAIALRINTKSFSNKFVKEIKKLSFK